MARFARPLQYAGVILAVFGLGKLHAVRHVYDYTGSTRFAWSFAYVALLAISSYSVGLPESLRTRGASWVAALTACGAAALGVSIAQLGVNSVLLPRLVVFGSAVVLVPWFVFCATLARHARSRAEDRERLIFVGRRDEGELLRDELAGRPERPAQLVTMLSCEEARSHGDRPPLIAAAEEAGATLLVLDREAQGDERIVAQAALLHERGLRVRTVSLFYEQWLGKLPIWELERVSLMFDIGEVHRTGYMRVKRLIDIGLATIALPALLISTPIVLVANRFGNQGPLFFRQQRVGKSGRTFTIWKFRTMVDLPGGVTYWTAEDDPRITPVGRALRSTHLDELPQLLNVLRGDLSIVGPRPEQPSYVEELVGKLPFYDLRHLVRPGMTGWRQVKFGYAGSEAEALEGLQFDFFYLRRQTLTFDLRIIGRTLRSIVRRQGR